MAVATTRMEAGEVGLEPGKMEEGEETNLPMAENPRKAVQVDY